MPNWNYYLDPLAETGLKTISDSEIPRIGPASEPFHEEVIERSDEAINKS